jgi:hypothetical protein
MQHPKCESKACVCTSYVQSTKEDEVQRNEVWDLRVAAPTVTVSYSVVKNFLFTAIKCILLKMNFLVSYARFCIFSNGIV